MVISEGSHVFGDTLMKIPLLISLLVGAVGLSMTAPAAAQTYPARPVKFVVASTGSPQDVIGRLFAQKIQES